MGVYHVCDFCGRDMDITDERCYFICIDEAEGTPPSGINHEICEDCAEQWANIISRVAASRYETDWDVKINSPRYRTIDGRSAFQDRKKLVEWSFC